MITETLTQSQFTDALKGDEYASWSYGATVALYEYLSDLSDDCGQDIELDIVAIRCEYSEYDTCLEYAKEFGDFIPCEADDEADEAKAREWLQERTTVLEAKTPNTDYSNGAKLGDYITSYVIASF